MTHRIKKNHLKFLVAIVMFATMFIGYIWCSSEKNHIIAQAAEGEVTSAQALSDAFTNGK